MIRVEGAVLLAPLALWSLARGWARPQMRRRLILGGVFSLAAYPLLLGIIGTCCFRGQAAGRWSAPSPSCSADSG